MPLVIAFIFLVLGLISKFKSSFEDDTKDKIDGYATMAWCCFIAILLFVMHSLRTIEALFANLN